ncbi:MAG: GNAT family N-acetyltransferase [Burkholderiaceae bacterium]|jgi:RimJ/RimL family protein N-acetyltransferase|nr:GNAT family N-acetyltransferase [Burkholderiaceae bacterium]
MVQIRKAGRIEGRTLALRDARVSDAAFIHALRTDATRARYLSPVPAEVQAQTDWLRRYEQDDTQAYFIIINAGRDGQAVGTVRLYGARGAAFSWGSWLLQPGLPARHAVESALMVYHYAAWLGFTEAYFEVLQENASVWRFHENFGACRVGDERGHFQYQLSATAMRAGMARYGRYLPHGIRVF